MLIKCKRIEQIGFEEPKQWTRIPCQFHISNIDYIEAEPKEEWANPNRPETRIILRSGHEYVIQFHYSSLSRLHEEFHQCEVIKGEL